jgi:hypothetical protein
MNELRSYDKFINKINNIILDLEHEIDSLPDIGIANFVSIILKNKELSSRVNEISYKLEQVRGKLRSAMDTYAITSVSIDNREVSLEPNEDESVSQGYLLKLMRLSEKVALLEGRLSQKNIREFMSDGKRNKDSSRIDWDDLKLDL